MRGYVEGDEPLQKLLGRLVVAEERVPVDVVQVAAVGRGASGQERLDRRRVQAEQLGEPRFDRVVGLVAYGLVQGDLAEGASRGGARGVVLFVDVVRVGAYRGRLHAQLLQELEGEGSAGSFVAVYGGR